MQLINKIACLTIGIVTSLCYIFIVANTFDYFDQLGLVSWDMIVFFSLPAFLAITCESLYIYATRQHFMEFIRHNWPWCVAGLLLAYAACLYIVYGYITLNEI